ncbi:hypothetical protein CTAYLR_008413 [Chrysophaeum taylorii]|uniref:Inositol monophosphatase n=1 Tax=Chrysophaeum taylorii TaxID=2483200 RepID=A0AAD7ULC7_9STRA|nr:hypothetical protein CTAYLR_008413 [Chrysophaeum taylorii]
MFSRRVVVAAGGVAGLAAAQWRWWWWKSREWKDDAGIDPCTQTDRDDEEVVVAGLRRAFPRDAVVGEEACSETGVIPGLGGRTWVVDPIDGTQNFVRGLPCSVVSLALCVDGSPRVGVVYDPHRNELFVAEAAKGAFLDGRLLSADAAPTKPENALVLTYPGYERENIDALVAVYRALLERKTRAIRVIGSSVLSLCWVAASRASAFIAGLANGDAPKPLDWVAATLIAREAGATFATIDGRRTLASEKKAVVGDGKFDLFSKSCVCANDPGLAADLKRLANAATSIF